jgi:hypothetical protein
MPKPIHLDSSGLRQSTTMMNQNAHLGSASPQITHLHLASPQSFSSARIPFSTIFSFGGLSNMRQSVAIKVQVSATLTVSRHAFTLFAFEPVTSTKQISLPKTALKATMDMQTLADVSQNLETQLTFQLIDASISNKDEMCSASQLAANEHKGLFNNKTAPTFRLIVRFKLQYQSKMQQDLVNFSLSETILIAKLGTSSIASQMMAYLNSNKVWNNNALSFFNNGCLRRYGASLGGPKTS